jgi:opacity protein-like surface antigen
MGYVQLGKLERGGTARAEGLNVSLVGKAPVNASWGVFGKLGTTWGRTDTTALAAGAATPGSESGFGFSYGAGVSWALSPRTTATLGWESYDFRFAGGRDPVRTTSLGLQWRY